MYLLDKRTRQSAKVILGFEYQRIVNVAYHRLTDSLYVLIAGDALILDIRKIKMQDIIGGEFKSVMEYYPT